MLGFGRNNPALRAVVGVALIAIGLERQAIPMVVIGVIALLLAGVSAATGRSSWFRGGRTTDWDQR